MATPPEYLGIPSKPLNPVLARPLLNAAERVKLATTQEELLDALRSVEYFAAEIMKSIARD